MSYESLVRWSGLAAMVGGAVLVVVEVMDGLFFPGISGVEAVASSAWILFNVLDVLLLSLVLLGLPGIYARQADQAGALGMIAFLVLFYGIVMLLGSLWTAAFVFPWLATAAPPELIEADPSGTVVYGFFLTIILMVLGGLLFGLASLRAGVLPRAAAVLLTIGSVMIAILEFSEMPFSGVLISAAMAWMGYAVWSTDVVETDPVPNLAA